MVGGEGREHDAVLQAWLSGGLYLFTFCGLSETIYLLIVVGLGRRGTASEKDFCLGSVPRHWCVCSTQLLRKPLPALTSRVGFFVLTFIDQFAKRRAAEDDQKEVEEEVERATKME